MKNINRRRFLKASLLTAGSASLWPALTGTRAAAQTNVNARVLGANDDIRIAVVGFNSRGMDHIKELRGLKGVRITALCDVDSAVTAKALKTFTDRNETVTPCTDIRKLLENKEVDAISIATPNHWHSLAAIWAIQAGKDVYVEKPVSHNIWEGGQLVAAAAKHGRIVQAGTQCRSNPGLIEAIAWLQAGNLGKILRARGLCYKRRASIGKTSGPQPVPATVDYDLWCGPAPKEPLRRAALHYDWHWVWPTGNGDLGNQGVHQMDIARWALGEPGLAPRVFSFGGRLGYEDDATTPNTLTVYHEYEKAPLIFEVRGLPAKSGATAMDNYRGAEIGVVIDCEHGYMVIPSYTGANAFDSAGKPVKTFEGGASHFANFLAAMRSRKTSDLRAPIMEGHISAALCHTGNISYRLGEREPAHRMFREHLEAMPDAMECLGRLLDHLRANDVALTKTPMSFGALLTVDPDKLRFVGNPDADKLLTSEYRAPFVVPEQV